MILFLKAQVKGHMRRLAGGRMALVRPHRREDAAGQGTPDLFAPRPAPARPIVAESVEPPAVRKDSLRAEEPEPATWLFCGKPVLRPPTSIIT